MERYAVDDADQEEGPVRAALGEVRVMAVIDGEKDVRCAGEVWQGFFERKRVRRLHKHEGHGGAEEDDVGVFVLVEVFAFEVSGRKVSLFVVAIVANVVSRVPYSCQNDMTCKKY